MHAVTTTPDAHRAVLRVIEKHGDVRESVVRHALSAFTEEQVSKALTLIALAHEATACAILDSNGRFLDRQWRFSGVAPKAKAGRKATQFYIKRAA